MESFTLVKPLHKLILPFPLGGFQGLSENSAFGFGQQAAGQVWNTWREVKSDKTIPVFSKKLGKKSLI